MPFLSLGFVGPLGVIAKVYFLAIMNLGYKADIFKLIDHPIVRSICVGIDMSRRPILKVEDEQDMI